MNINLSLIIENQYFGTINYIKKLSTFTNVEIEQYEYYQKMSFRNRCVIVGSNGTINLSVPLQNGRNTKAIMKDVKINYADNWQQQHYRTLVSCYSNSPFFEYYQNWLESFYKKRFDYLLDMNMEILLWLKRVLKFQTEISLTSAFNKTVERNVTDCRNEFLPSNFKKEQNIIKYEQVFEDRIGFQNNLSILDLLFCTGPQASAMLQGNSNA